MRKRELPRLDGRSRSESQQRVNRERGQEAFQIRRRTPVPLVRRLHRPGCPRTAITAKPRTALYMLYSTAPLKPEQVVHFHHVNQTLLAYTGSIPFISTRNVRSLHHFTPAVIHPSASCALFCFPGSSTKEAGSLCGRPVLTRRCSTHRESISTLSVLVLLSPSVPMLILGRYST